MSRIAIQLGSTRIEYEGDQEFIESKLLQLVREIMELGPPPVEALPQAIPNAFSTADGSKYGRSHTILSVPGANSNVSAPS